jgi:hypothetical protein
LITRAASCPEHGRYPPTHATVRLTPLHPAGRDEQGGELAGQVDLVLHGEDALVADLLLPGETMALLNPVLGITLSLPGSACQGGMQATGDCQQAIQGAGAGPTYQAWLHLGSQKVVVVAASQPEYQVQQQAMAGTNTDAQRGTVDQQAVPCAAAQHHVTGRVATSGTVPAGLVWGQVVRVSQCTSRWQGGGRVPVVTGELRVLGPSPDCRTCILQLELEQSSKVSILFGTSQVSWHSRTSQHGDDVADGAHGIIRRLLLQCSVRAWWAPSTLSGSLSCVGVA